jgi:hypothetical protein
MSWLSQFIRATGPALGPALGAIGVPLGNVFDTFWPGSTGGVLAPLPAPGRPQGTPGSTLPPPSGPSVPPAPATRPVAGIPTSAYVVLGVAVLVAIGYLATTRSSPGGRAVFA